MADKTSPLGICDHCGNKIPVENWHTRRGPRRYCSIECKNTANSRIGAPVRSAKAKVRVATGIWHNPRSKMTKEQIHATQTESSRKARLREVAEGRWRNPALTDEARQKLSRPRRLTGILHSAQEKLYRGLSMHDLTQEERDAYHEYRRELRERKQKVGLSHG